MEQSLNTKRMFCETLTELMAEKPFDKITVSELTKRCGVNRQTFYYHFATINDLLLWNLTDKGGDLLSGFTDNPFTWKEGILQCLYYVRENSAPVLCALRSTENQQIRGFFIRYFREVFAGLFDFICRDLDVDQEFKDFILNLHIIGAAGLVVQWLESGMKESPEQITEWLAFYLEGNVRGTFERYAEWKDSK